jgi:hypothetical protein
MKKSPVTIIDARANGRKSYNPTLTSEKKIVGKKDSRKVVCPKCHKGEMIPNPNFPEDERSCNNPKCRYQQIHCAVCGKWTKNYAYGNCKKCHGGLYNPNSEDLS